MPTATETEGMAQLIVELMQEVEEWRCNNACAEENVRVLEHRNAALQQKVSDAEWFDAQQEGWRLQDGNGVVDWEELRRIRLEIESADD